MRQSNPSITARKLNQSLQLIRSRHLVSHNSIFAAPNDFLVVALIAADVSGPPFLSPHLVRKCNLQKSAVEAHDYAE